MVILSHWFPPHHNNPTGFSTVQLLHHWTIYYTLTTALDPSLYSLLHNWTLYCTLTTPLDPPLHTHSMALAPPLHTHSMALNTLLHWALRCTLILWHCSVTPRMCLWLQLSIRNIGPQQYKLRNNKQWEDIEGRWESLVSPNTHFSLLEFSVPGCYGRLDLCPGTEHHWPGWSLCLRLHSVLQEPKLISQSKYYLKFPKAGRTTTASRGGGEGQEVTKKEGEMVRDRR